MNNFIEMPVKNKALSHRKLAFGVGINDADYKTTFTDKTGKEITCPFYRKWTGMLARCYSDKTQKRQPAYIGCSVCDDWLVFTKFKSWMSTQDWEGMQIDKDLVSPGNKIYSPIYCIFVPQHINLLLTDCRRSRGKWPLGVGLNKSSGKFSAICSVNGTGKHLGWYDTSELASNSYREFKSNHIKKIAREYISDVRLYDALINRAKLIAL